MTNHERTPTRLIDVTLDEKSVTFANTKIEHEMRVAIADLLHDNHFHPHCVEDGPYKLLLATEGQRLLLHITTATHEDIKTVSLPTQPFRSIIRDYFMICESYREAVDMNDPRKIEAVDMGRRGIHDEGAQTLIESLEDRVDINFSTARRLFTLITILHMKSS